MVGDPDELRRQTIPTGARRGRFAVSGEHEARNRPADVRGEIRDHPVPQVPTGRAHRRREREPPQGRPSTEPFDRVERPTGTSRSRNALAAFVNHALEPAATSPGRA